MVQGVPFPPLPFLAQTAIGLAANRGEGSTLRRWWNDTKNGRKIFASDKGRFAETLHTTHNARLHGKPADRNVHFYFNTHFSSCSLLPRVHKPVPPNQTRTPHRNPDFRDTCDGGVLIGKLPCTSTLAQSVAAPAATARGAPAPWPHEQSTFVSWGGKQRSSNVAPPSRPSVLVDTVTPKQGTASRSPQPDKMCNPPPLLHLPQAENSTAWRPPLGSQLNNTGD